MVLNLGIAFLSFCPFVLLVFFLSFSSFLSFLFFSFLFCLCFFSFSSFVSCLFLSFLFSLSLFCLYLYFLLMFFVRLLYSIHLCDTLAIRRIWRYGPVKSKKATKEKIPSRKKQSMSDAYRPCIDTIQKTLNNIWNQLQVIRTQKK